MVVGMGLYPTLCELIRIWKLFLLKGWGYFLIRFSKTFVFLLWFWLISSSS